MRHYLATLANSLREQPLHVILPGAAALAVLFGLLRGDPGATGYVGALLVGMAAIRPRDAEPQEPSVPVFSEPERRNGCKRVLIVGAGEIGLKIASELMKQTNGACQVIGFVDDDPNAASLPGVRILGSRMETMDLVERHGIDEVIISHAPSWQQRLAEDLIRNGKRHLNVRMVPGVYEAMIGKPKFGQVDDIPLMELPHRADLRGYERAKRAMDVLFSVAGLLVCLPLGILIAGLIKLTSRGPVIYRQERIGKDGKVFNILKLRTMVQDAEAETGPCLSTREDQRVTGFGRLLRATKLDELPQFINVLRGEMSLVGPRPERPCFVEQFTKQIPAYRERHRVLPGITGLAQVHGFYETAVETKLKYDLMYIYNRSLLQDLKIILMTARAVLPHRGR